MLHLKAINDAVKGRAQLLQRQHESINNTLGVTMEAGKSALSARFSIDEQVRAAGLSHKLKGYPFPHGKPAVERELHAITATEADGAISQSGTESDYTIFDSGANLFFIRHTYAIHDATAKKTPPIFRAAVKLHFRSGLSQRRRRREAKPARASSPSVAVAGSGML